MGNPHWMVCWCIETKKGDLGRPRECLEVYMLWREGRRSHIWCLDRSETETGIWWRCRVGGGDGYYGGNQTGWHRSETSVVDAPASAGAPSEEETYAQNRGYVIHHFPSIIHKVQPQTNNEDT